MSWFKEWFDSPLYEKIYSNRDLSEAAVVADLICKELPVSDYPTILDLGCGRGRHSITLAKRGYKVT
ncbi:SAM-dependent methyltransferase, partial [Rhodohalobacter halophilus]|uniref:SAM-dependent methyltransferase n=1 Tax=Rhodohalobacter halophilus TaxID=1812810 RepID=UPI001C4056B3